LRDQRGRFLEIGATRPRAATGAAIYFLLVVFFLFDDRFAAFFFFAMALSPPFTIAKCMSQESAVNAFL
jgi:hypothetical protein